MNNKNILLFHKMVGNDIFNVMMGYFNDLEQKKINEIETEQKNKKKIISTINFFYILYEDLLDEIFIMNDYQCRLDIINRYIIFKRKPEATEPLLKSMRKTMLNLFNYTPNELSYHDLILTYDNNKTLKLNVILLMLLYFNYNQFTHFSLIINCNPFILTKKKLH